MTDFLQYVVQQVKSKNISELDAIEILRQYEAGNTSTRFGPLHPLIHQNTSTLLEHRFTSEFFDNEPLIIDFGVKDQHILPGLACVEMVTVAVLQATDSGFNSDVSLRLHDINWSLPITVEGEGRVIHTILIPESVSSINFEIYGKIENAEENPVVYCQGHVEIADDVSTNSVFNISDFIAGCEPSRLCATDCYKLLEKAGMQYGPYYRVIEEFFSDKDHVLAKLSLPSFTSADADKLVLHPGLLDGVLQVSLCCGLKENGKLNSPLLPLALEELKIFHPLGSQVWALIRATGDGDSNGKQLNVDLYDDIGRLCAQLKGLVLHVPESNSNRFNRETEHTALMVQPYWREKPVDAALSEENYAKRLIVFCESANDLLTEIENKNEKQFNGVSCVNLNCEHNDIGVRYETYAAQILELLQTVLRDKLKVPVLVQVVIPYRMSEQVNEKSTFSGLLGLLKTAHVENPKLKGQVIEVDVDTPVEALIKYLFESSSAPVSAHICYRDGKRWEADWREVEEVLADSRALSLPWKAGGVYLITGGTGGLGFMFANDIVRHANDAKIILTGRSSLSEKKLKSIEALRSKGAKISYRQIDVTDRQAVLDLIRGIQEEFGTLNGIIHSAGLIRDNFILKKTQEELHEVLAPKVVGLLNLDQATLDTNLDFMAVFSSMAGALGNVGQADYAAGNAFMDAYTHYRNGLVDNGHRRGHTVSINWPLWKDGGMHIDEHSEQAMTQSTGMIALKTETGLRAFYQAVAKGGQWMVMEGIRDRIQERLLGRVASSGNVGNYQAPLADSNAPEVEVELLHEKTLHRIKKMFGEVIKLGLEKIDGDEPLEYYGIDSIMVTHLNRKLAGVFGGLSKTLFYEYQTLAELTEYLTDEHRSTCLQWTGMDEQVIAITDRLKVEPSQENKNVKKYFTLNSFKEKNYQTKRTIGYSTVQQNCEPMAIVGLTGRYPQASNLDEFWENLISGRDCICEIPQDRWTLQDFFVEDRETAIEKGKSYCKWGGFLEGFSDFDPLFFKMSPREAMAIDPQERLFLQCCWEVLEDAGYPKAQLKEKYNRKIGVFVGITKTGHELYGHDSWKQGSPVYPYTSFSSVANRISYFLDLQGPSMPIDTMCSSSLVAIHEACNRIRQHECEMAIAGGVNLYLHPSSYIKLCAGRLISNTEICAAFGEMGNGFVPGEGVGCVLLKPLSLAKKDRDHIHAVILGTHSNHNGKTSGYMVPNPIAQYNLAIENFQKSGVDPRTISYVESAANGSSLGDPIEFNALTKAFTKLTDDKGFCAIGSVKPNIGHLEAASGISQLTKVILQLQHQQLVPSIHTEPLNPNLSFDNTPFYLQRDLQEWTQPIIKLKDEVQKIPRRATVSSFGAGGVNAHLIIEEYTGAIDHTVAECSSKNEVVHSDSTTIPQIVVLSARNDDRLFALIGKMINFLELHKSGDIHSLSLSDIAYTLQVGREAMESRIALVVNNMEELVQGLKDCILSLGNGKDIESYIPVFKGKVGEDGSKIRGLFSGGAGDAMIKVILEDKNIEKIALLWALGNTIPWALLHDLEKVKKVSLPTYAFEEKSYWIVEEFKKNGVLDYVSEVEFNYRNGYGFGLKQELKEILFDYKANKHSLASTSNRIKKVFS